MERNELLKKVAYLTDNINKKVRKFKENGNGAFYENKLNYATAKYDRKIKLTMESGYLTKSKNELGKLSTKELEGLYNRLHELQTNKDWGTVNRFKETEKVKLGKSASTLRDLIGEEKFNELMGNKTEVDFMKEFIKKKEELAGGRGKSYASSQVMYSMYLELPNITKEDEQDTLRTVQTFDRANEMLSRNTVQMEGRRKNGNR